ncbi:MAG: M20/M25/M40 family metallo-hydrolase [Candidatus Solibacter usitatus]|nr:M20/M25/M40 family metallo-hydrolase [Candidatus Solibacter usitatus]
MRYLAALAFPSFLFAQAPPKAVDARVAKMVAAVSTARVEASMRKLESFGTRGNYTDPTWKDQGIGAARRWILQEFKSYSPKLDVRFDTYRVKKQQRIFRDVEIVNVVATLRGTRYPDHQIVISGHYDSLNLMRRGNQERAENAIPPVLSDEEQSKRANAPAPGVSDDASGVAATLELARVLSQYEFDKTLVFIAFAGEEIGLLGSTLHAQKAKSESQIIDAVLNSDIIGTEVSDDGRRDNRTVRVFSADPADSPSRHLARYIHDAGRRYFPKFETQLVFRADRVGRGGDHTPFANEGFAAVRFTSAVENLAQQHSEADTVANASPQYTADVTRLKAAVAASLASAPKAPVTARGLSRGRSGYGATLRWKDEETAPDLAGYAVVYRSTLSPSWQHEVFAGKKTELTLPNVDIDNLVFGVKAIDADGNESLVSSFSGRASAYSTPRKIETY